MLIFIAKVGIDSYFSTELAFYRSMLGDYVSGIGVYYYIGMMLIPATLLILSYLITYPNFKNIFLFVVIIIISSILLVPLGGRGRVINLILIILISYWITRENFSLKKILSFRIILLFVFISLISLIWSNFREKNENEVNIESISIIGGLATDMTRLQTQSFIFSKYPISGIYFGETYLSALLGPIAKYISFFTADYLSQLSSDWYFESLGAIDLKSAISPSFIGEIYMNFGFFGIIISPFFFFFVINMVVNLLTNEHALSQAVVIYYFQFSFFHGGLYVLFDILLTTVPLFLIIKYLTDNIESKTLQPS
jgi:hypothetical protein